MNFAFPAALRVSAALLVLACLGSTAMASGDQKKKKINEQIQSTTVDSKAPAAEWTPERMRNAKPAKMIRKRPPEKPSPPKAPPDQKE